MLVVKKLKNFCWNWEKFNEQSGVTIVAAQHRVHPTGGSRRVLKQFTWLKAGFNQVAGNARYWALRQVRNLVYFYLDEIERIFYNLVKENTHEKNNRFI